jgi:TonB family protein
MAYRLHSWKNLKCHLRAYLAQATFEIMQGIDKKVFRVVTGVHVVIFVLLLSYGFLSGCFRPKPDRVIPVEFLVDARPLASDPVETVSEPTPPQPRPDPPQPRPPRDIQVNTNRIVRQPGPPPPPPPPVGGGTLTAEQIRDLLGRGATASDRTAIPDEDGRGLAIIQQTLYAVWQAPSRAAVGDAETTVELQLAADGTVRSARIVRPSGNPVLDESVGQTITQVGRIHGLPSGFTARRPRVTIAFVVE